MGCCGPDKREEPKETKEKENKENLNDKIYENEGKRSKSIKNIWAWGVGVVLIVGLLAMLL